MKTHKYSFKDVKGQPLLEVGELWPGAFALVFPESFIVLKAQKPYDEDYCCASVQVSGEALNLYPSSWATPEIAEKLFKLGIWTPEEFAESKAAYSAALEKANKQIEEREYNTYLNLHAKYGKNG